MVACVSPTDVKMNSNYTIDFIEQGRRQWHSIPYGINMQC